MRKSLAFSTNLNKFFLSLTPFDIVFDFKNGNYFSSGRMQLRPDLQGVFKSGTSTKNLVSIEKQPML